MVMMASLGPMKLVALAERLMVNPSTAMRMVDRLETAGFVQRQANPQSRREVLLCLTDVGRQVVDDVTARRRADIAAVVARVPRQQRAGLVSALQTFTAAGQSFAGQPFTSPLGWQ